MIRSALQLFGFLYGDHISLIPNFCLPYITLLMSRMNGQPPFVWAPGEWRNRFGI
jgi:hypothetical protein